MKRNEKGLWNWKQSHHKRMSGKEILQVLERLRKDTLSENEREKEITKLLVNIGVLTDETK
ncbi:MAG: hypothetical protein ACC630_04420 [Nitrospinota bacterium]